MTRRSLLLGLCALKARADDTWLQPAKFSVPVGATVVLEVAPGSVFPDHDHSAPERGLVLTGDLRTGERLLGAGDFYEAAAGARHERIASPSGCTGSLGVGAEAWRRWRELAIVR